MNRSAGLALEAKPCDRGEVCPFRFVSDASDPSVARNMPLSEALELQCRMSVQCAGEN